MSRPFPDFWVFAIAFSCGPRLTVRGFTAAVAEEGAAALFKGGPARVLRSSPQFGVVRSPFLSSTRNFLLTISGAPPQTLVAYENLKKHFPFPEPNQSLMETVLPREEEMARVRARNALKGTSTVFRFCFQIVLFVAVVLTRRFSPAVLLDVDTNFGNTPAAKK